MASGCNQSSQELLSKLDNLLAECTSLEEYPKQQVAGHGSDYAVQWDEMRKVATIFAVINNSWRHHNLNS